MKFIFYIPILLVQVLSLHRSSTNTLQSVQSSKWPLNLNENTRTVSKLESCVSQECRSFDEVKDLAACKASKLAKLIPHPIKYAYNEYKGKAQNEYTKFVYIIDAESEENGAISGGLRYMRLCVPIDKSKDAWIDDKCPLDSCDGEYKRNAACLTSLSRNEKSLAQKPMEDNIRSFEKKLENLQKKEEALKNIKKKDN